MATLRIHACKPIKFLSCYRGIEITNGIIYNCPLSTLGNLYFFDADERIDSSLGVFLAASAGLGEIHGFRKNFYNNI
jgi:hypothetical protein